MSGDAVPAVSTGKNCYQVVSNLMRDKLRITLSVDSIMAAYRVGVKPLNLSPDKRRIVAKLLQRDQKRNILHASRVSKPPGLFVNESLPQNRSKLLYSVRQVKE